MDDGGLVEDKAWIIYPSTSWKKVFLISFDLQIGRDSLVNDITVQVDAITLTYQLWKTIDFICTTTSFESIR
jgi:hypothetical protein